MKLTLWPKLLRIFARRSPLRPPGAVAENDFFRRCIKCNKCIQVCPYQSLRSASAGFGLKMGTPVVIARETPCYLCMECPPVCPTGALDDAVTAASQVKMGVAEIDQDLCFAYNGVICRSCFERCPIYREAITLRDELFPEVNSEKCVGCGVCEHVCPAGEAAITVSSRHPI